MELKIQILHLIFWGSGKCVGRIKKNTFLKTQGGDASMCDPELGLLPVHTVACLYRTHIVGMITVVHGGIVGMITVVHEGIVTITIP